MTNKTKVQGPSRRLTFDDAVQIWLRRWMGAFQHRIAAEFDTNPGRVNEVLKGRRHVGSREVALRLKKTKNQG